MGTEVDADTWWDRLTPTRKVQIYRWIERPDTFLPPTPGQLALLPKEGEDNDTEDPR